ncbi:hypothetical protein Tco_0215531 [Tanacetum coccineum]
MAPGGQTTITVIVAIRSTPRQLENFMVGSDSPSPSNGIIGRPGILSDTQLVPSRAHGSLIPRRRRNCHHLQTPPPPPKECNTVTGRPAPFVGCGYSPSEAEKRVASSRAALSNPGGVMVINVRMVTLADVRGLHRPQQSMSQKAWFPRILDRTKDGISPVSRQNQSGHPTSFTAHDERSPVVKWEVSRFEQIPIQVSRQVTPLVQNTQEVCCEETGKGDSLDYGSRRSFHAAQAAYRALPYACCTLTSGRELIIYLSAMHGALALSLLTE